jgi:DMSO/TMAO reductase YedYZ heme-binding membrane subunit
MSEMAYYTGNPTANALRRIVAVLAVTLSVPSITSYHSINLNIDRNLDTLCQQLLLC